MKLSRPFMQLPVLFDVARLQAEVATLPAEAWTHHPDRLAGNSASRLISASGQETDAVQGEMRPTCWLSAMPYTLQALAGFGVVWSRARLMRLAAGAIVPEHADVNYHWHTRVRLHIPIATRPEVLFHCDGQTVNMAAGEAWIFDNWRRHHVENRSNADRIHLVADTTGTAAFWRFVNDQTLPHAQWQTVNWDPERSPQLLTESNQRSAIMPAAEVQMLLEDLVQELMAGLANEVTQTRLLQFSRLVEDFVRDWRQLCALNGTKGQGRKEFLHLARAFYGSAKPLTVGLVMRTNSIAAQLVLEQRVLEHLVADIVTD